VSLKQFYEKNHDIADYGLEKISALKKLYNKKKKNEA